MSIVTSTRSFAIRGLRVLRRALSLLDHPSSAQEQLSIQLSRLSRRYRQSACSCVACKYGAPSPYRDEP